MVIDMSVEYLAVGSRPIVRVTVIGADEVRVSGIPAPDLVDALERATSARVVLVDRDVPALLPGHTRGAMLSEREAEIVRLIAEGLSNQEIADRLFLSINTIKSYIRSSYCKIGATSRSQAVLWAVGSRLRPVAEGGAADGDVAGP